MVLPTVEQDAYYFLGYFLFCWTENEVTVTESVVEPISRCSACGQEDDHPKHTIAVGFNSPATNGELFHEHDHDRDGVIHYHFDCPSEWHDLHSKLATIPRPSPDPAMPWLEWKQEQADEHRAVADIHAAKIAKCKSGLKGDELRQWIKNLNPRGGAGGMDQVIATAVLAALGPNSGTTTVGTKTMTGPTKMRLMTANGSDTAAGTELATSGGYTAGGTAMSMGTAATGSIASNASVSWTNMPSTTLTGPEQWDSSATPQRPFWGPWSGGNIAVSSASTFTVASGSYSDTLA